MKRLTISGIILIAMTLPVAGLAKIDVNSTINKKSSILGKIHKKASKALVNAAQDKSYVNFLKAEEAQRDAHRPKIDNVSLNVQKKFHVEEMCLIDAEGPELARIVGNEIAYDLSPDESGADFFKPGFETAVRKSYTSIEYMSPDANKWVIAYVSPVSVDGQNRAILHYEHGLDVYQKALNKGLNGEDDFIVAVNEKGFVVSDSRSTIGVDKKGDFEAMGDYFGQFEIGGQSLGDVLQTIDAGQNIQGSDGKILAAAYKKVGSWTLIVFSTI